MDRGKVLWEKDLEELKNWKRFEDVDKDGITWRTVPGNKHPRSAWFTRGTGHNVAGAYSEKAVDWEQNMDRLKKKFKTARNYIPEAIIETAKGAEVGIIAYGSSDQAVIEARDYLAEDGLKTDYLRLRAVPFTDKVTKFIEDHKVIYVVEMNRDGQMLKILQMEYPQFATKFVSIVKYDGLPLNARWMKEAIQAEEQSHD